MAGKGRAPSELKKILVAVDGSEHSNKAVDLAVSMAKKWKAKIYLIHVVDAAIKSSAMFPEYIAFDNRTKIPEEYMSDREPKAYFDKICEQILEMAHQRVLKSGIKNVEPICITGNPADEIIKAAKQYKVDQIIMGSRGMGGFSKAIMGSVSTKVCNFADVTCVTVK